MTEIIHDGLMLLALVAFASLAVVDFRTLRIRNRHVLGMMVLAVAALALRSRDVLLPDLAAGLLLFALGFVFWWLRMMGAGDAKLYLPLGVLVGWSGLAVFALLLLPVSLLVLVVIRTGGRWLPRGRVTERLEILSQTRRIPYGVPMALAAMGAIVARWL
ncbi:MAG: prepilin peptidase [Roseovarius sp.]|nr:prepilin peptidase [Roseovarius sp.]